MSHKCCICGGAATCVGAFMYNGERYMCDKCFVIAYNKYHSENHQCSVCGRFGVHKYKVLDGRWICSVACLKSYYGFKDLDAED